LFHSSSYAFFHFYGFIMSSFITPDSPLSLILAVLLLVTGLGVAAYVLVLVFSAAVDSCGGLFERAVFHRYSKRCDQGDELLEKGDFAGAIHLFGRAFFLRPIRRDSALLSDVATYHTGLLSRLLTVADEMGKGRARLPSLADVDHLLTERLEMHFDYFRALKQGNGQRMREIERRLRHNEGQVRLAVNQLIDEVRASEERVLYH
jgi:hypothetical protein